MFTDLSGPPLYEYRSAQDEPVDFVSFWSETLSEASAFDIDVVVTPVESPLRVLSVWDVSFRGFGGQRVRGWLRRPTMLSGDLPVVVEYVGYGGGRGLAEDSLFWTACGFAHFQMDTRGQGATWSVGDTPDEGVVGPRVPGMMTAGIHDRFQYYYRRLITDAVRAFEAVSRLDGIDNSRMTALGTSQGGGLALAVAGLSPQVAQLVSYVPFLCDFPRAITITDADPYKEISRYLSVHRAAEATVLETLQYFDGVNFARHAKAPAEFTTGLMDEVCPPSTVMAAFNEYRGPKNIQVWTHNGHQVSREDDIRVAVELQRQFAM